MKFPVSIKKVERTSIILIFQQQIIYRNKTFKHCCVLNEQGCNTASESDYNNVDMYGICIYFYVSNSNIFKNS